MNRAASAGDALCVALACAVVADVVQLGLEPRALVLAVELSLFALLLARHVATPLVLLVPVLAVLLGVVAPGTNDQTVVQAGAMHLAAYWAGRRGTFGVRVAACLLAVGSILTIELQKWPLDRTDVSDVIYLSAPSLLALALGRRLTVRSGERAELRALQAQLAVELAERTEQVLAAERERISRELHDVVAQGAGAVVAQATAARLLLEQQGRLPEARAAMVAVEDTAREALADMRRLLGVLRAPDEPEQLVAP
jgi:signal transduction histidine kinase